MNDIAQRILALITEKNISYGDISKATGISKSALQRYATGQTEKIPIDRLELIAKSLGTTTEYLMGWDTEKDAVRTKKAMEIAGLLSQASDDQMAQIAQYIRFVLSENKG